MASVVTQSPSELKRAGLLFRDAATVLCGTLLVEFVMEQADCLEKKLKPVLEVLPGVERQLKVFECDWRVLREDIELMLAACARFKADPPTTGVCDYLAELYGPKKWAYSQLRALKIFIAATVKAVEEAAAIALHPTLEDLAAAGTRSAEAKSGIEAKHEAKEGLGVAGEIVGQQKEGQDQPASFMGPSVTSDVSQKTSDTFHDDGIATERAAKKKKKKKQKKAKKELLKERPEYEIVPEEEKIITQLATHTKMMGLEAASTYDQFSLARAIVANSEGFNGCSSPRFFKEQAICLLHASASFSVEASESTLENPNFFDREAVSALLKAAVLFRRLADASPSDDFARWDLAEVDYRLLLFHWPILESHVAAFHAREAVELLRVLHSHRRHYAPLWNVTPEAVTELLTLSLGRLAETTRDSEPATTVRLQLELLALPPPVPKRADDDSFSRYAAIHVRCQALLAVGSAAMKEGCVEKALAAAADGINHAQMTHAKDEKEGELWMGQFRELRVWAWAHEEARLVKLLSIRKTQTKARASQGRLDSEEQKGDVAKIKRELEVVRAALRDV